MRKWIAMLLALVMCLSLCACGKEADADQEDADGGKKPEELKMLLVSAIHNTDIRNDESGITFNFFDALIDGFSAFGVDEEQARSLFDQGDMFDYTDGLTGVLHYGYTTKIPKLFAVSDELDGADQILFGGCLRVGAPVSDAEAEWGIPYRTETADGQTHETYYLMVDDGIEGTAFVNPFVKIDIDVDTKAGTVKGYEVQGIDSKSDELEHIPLMYMPGYLAVNAQRKTGPDRGGTVGVEYWITNESDRTIKYITFNLEPINAVGDTVESEEDGESLKSVRFTGPFEGGTDTVSHVSEENVWVNSDIDTIMIRSIDIVYMDDPDTAVHIEGPFNSN